MPLVSDEPTTATNESTSRPRGGDANAGNPVWRILRPVSVPIAVALLLQILGSLASAIPLRAMTRIVDGLTRGTDAVWPAVWWFIGGLGGALALGSLALLLTHLVDLRVQAGLREQLADKLSRLHWDGLIRAPPDASAASSKMMSRPSTTSSPTRWSRSPQRF